MPGRRGSLALAALAAGIVLACGGTPRRRPSFLLFIMDTTRADAVSAYGEVRGTTPSFDALARKGVLYRRAYATAPWTLPSHASLFTGLLPRRHGVGWRNTHMPDSLTTLAERFAQAGYATFGYSENVWVGKAFGLAQGFDTFVQASPRPRHAGPPLEERLAAFLADRAPEQPFFAFVNVIDAHWPWGQGPVLPLLPAGVTPAEARAVSQLPDDRQCRSEPDRRAIAILRGLYLGDVAQADAKLGRAVSALRSAGVFHDTVIIAASDHGELLGDHGVFGHQYSLDEGLLHVPLVVRGAPEAKPAAVDRAVSLVDVFPSLLAWAGLPPSRSLDGERLPIPTEAPEAQASPRTLFADYTDPAGAAPGDESRLGRGMREQARLGRAGCSPERWPALYGDLEAAIDPPWMLVRHARLPDSLFDVSGRTPQRVDPTRAGAAPGRAERRLAAALDGRATTTRGTGGAAPAPGAEPVSPEVVDALQSLGYVAEDAPDRPFSEARDGRRP